MALENGPNEQVKPTPPIDFSKPVDKPQMVQEGGEKLREKLEGSVSGPCKHESMKNKEGKDEKNLVGLTGKQRKELGVKIKDYVNLTNSKTGETKRYMVVHGTEEHKYQAFQGEMERATATGGTNFTANGIENGTNITVQK